MLGRGLIERRREVRLLLLAALAGEHTLLIGPPGTAKSELARRLHWAFRDARYFERLLTRFSVPEELFGPLSIAALEQDRYERQTAGFLPEASIAFIDEVFKANSAILNALLTLLNEREFDNGAGRQRCPLISVVGATNAVPEDEVADAFMDRFLLRLPVRPVSAEGFMRLLSPTNPTAPDGHAPLDEAERRAIGAAARRVVLPDAVAATLAALRAALEHEPCYVSDRRWVKVAWLLKVAAATDARSAVSHWDLWLLPWCLAADAERQRWVADWLVARLGVREGVGPERLTRIVEAFEAQLQAEREANDLDYDEAGRLKLGPDLADEVGDAKGGARALRLTYTRKRRYGECHVQARIGQIDALLERIGRYAAELHAWRDELTALAATSLWLDEVFAADARVRLDVLDAGLEQLTARALAARAGFGDLPRLARDTGWVPEPVAHEPLPL